MALVLHFAGRILFGVSLSWTIILSANGQHAQSALMVRGDSAYQAFDNERAFDVYQRALALDTTSFDVLMRLSRTGYDLGLDLMADDKKEAALTKFEDSILHAQSLVQQFPDSAQSHFLLAATMGNLALFKGGREKIMLGRRVEQHSKQAIQLDPALAYPYVSLGIYYREVSKLNWLEKALVKVFFGQLPESSVGQALDLLYTAQRLKPNFPFLQFELAMTFLSLGQDKDAIEHLETLISMKPENTQDMRNQAFAKGLIGELKRKALG